MSSNLTADYQLTTPPPSPRAFLFVFTNKHPALPPSLFSFLPFFTSAGIKPSHTLTSPFPLPSSLSSLPVFTSVDITPFHLPITLTPPHPISFLFPSLFHISGYQWYCITPSHLQTSPPPFLGSGPKGPMSSRTQGGISRHPSLRPPPLAIKTSNLPSQPSI